MQRPGFQVEATVEDPARPPWWRGAALYQVYLRSFQDSNGDGIGDLRGLLQRLPYIADLGVDGIWITPFFPSPLRDMGYDVSDHRAVDPGLGTLHDFDEVVAQAHRLGLKVIIDQVWSHTAQEHAWFEESRASRDNPKADWYVWASAKADGGPPNNWLSWMGGPAWRWEPRRRQYHLHNFLPQMPDLNFHCPQVQDAVLDTARFWLERGVDGFRLDTANLYFHSRGLEDNPPSATEADMPVLMQIHRHNADQPESLPFFERLRPLLDAYGACAVGEIGGAEPLPTMVAYTGGRARLHTAYSFALLGDRPTPAALAGHMADWQTGAAAQAWPSWALSNHDVARVASRWSGAADGGFAFGGARAGPGHGGGSPQLWMALLMVLRGTVFIYQGEELGLPQSDVAFEQMQDPFGLANWPLHKGRDGCRTPMPWAEQAPMAGFSTAAPWLPADEAHHRLAVDRQQADPQSMWHFTRRLLAMRASHPALRLGRFETVTAQEHLLELRRVVDRGDADRNSPADDVVWAVFNLGPHTLHHPITWTVNELLQPLAIQGAHVEAGQAVLPPWSALIVPLPSSR